jgi:hypothetical protein
MKLLRLQAIYAKRRGAVEGDDVDVTTHDFVIDDEVFPDAGGVGDTHNLATMEADFREFWDQLQGFSVIGVACGLKEYRWYRQDDGNLPWGDPARVQTIVGGPDWGVGATCPPQISCTVTEETGSRRHWGRFYIPGIAVGALDTDGSLLDARANSIAQLAATLYDSWQSRGVTPIVLGSIAPGQSLTNIIPVPIIGGTFDRWIGKNQTDERVRVAFPVTRVRVDDVLDVQRRRRFESPLARVSVAV